VNEGCVPNIWKHAVITPVPKVKPVTKIADLRPISVTPCDNYERGKVRISSITTFQYFKLIKFKIKFYILSETFN